MVLRRQNSHSHFGQLPTLSGPLAFSQRVVAALPRIQAADFTRYLTESSTGCTRLNTKLALMSRRLGQRCGASRQHRTRFRLSACDTCVMDGISDG